MVPGLIDHSSKSPARRATVRKRRREGFRTIEKLGAAPSSSPASQQARLLSQLIRFYGDQQTFARLAGFSLRSVAHYKSGRMIRGSNGRRILELERLKEELKTIMKPDAVPAWLQRPNPLFQNLKPIEVIERGNMDWIWRLIYLGQSGSPS